MSLAQLIYSSEINPDAFAGARPMGESLNAMLERAQEQNQKIIVTGILLYSAGHFLQVLEGHPLVLTRLFNKISLDPRHKNVTELAYFSCECRMFDRWFMGMLNLDERRDIDPGIFERFRECAKYALDDISAKRSVLSLLHEFKQRLECDPVVC